MAHFNKSLPLLVLDSIEIYAVLGVFLEAQGTCNLGSLSLTIVIFEAAGHSVSVVPMYLLYSLMMFCLLLMVLVSPLRGSLTGSRVMMADIKSLSRTTDETRMVKCTANRGKKKGTLFILWA